MTVTLLGPRMSALHSIITAMLPTPFSFGDLHSITEGLKTANYHTYENTRCEVTCDITDPNCARQFDLVALAGDFDTETKDFHAWQQCKNLCTTLDECTGFELEVKAAEGSYSEDYYSCMLYYEFVHSCDYYVGSLCFVKECKNPGEVDPVTGKVCQRLPNVDIWGMRDPLLFQHLTCPSSNPACKGEGESCDAENRCRANENLECTASCRTFSVCKKTKHVNALQLLTHALIQCPIPAVSVTNPPPEAVTPPNTPKYAEGVTARGFISQASVASGPYIISSPGIYKLSEDITFEFDDPPFSAYASQGKQAGHIGGIEIRSDDVVLDLNGFSIKQTFAHFQKQRFWSHVVIGNQVFPRGTGGFDSVHVPQSRIVIKNGMLCLTSHFGIRGLNAQHVKVDNVTFHDFEIAAISLVGARNVELSNLVLDNKNFETSVSVDYSVWFLTYRSIKFLETQGMTFPELESNSLIKNMILKKSGASEVNNTVIDGFGRKEKKTSQGNMYGIHITSSLNVVLNNVKVGGIENTGGTIKAIRKGSSNGPVRSVEGNALHYDWFLRDDGSRIDSSTMTQEEAIKVLIFKAQVWSMRQFADNNIAGFSLEGQGINNDFISRVFNPSADMSDIIPWTGNDIRAHASRGAFGVFVANSQKVKMSNVHVSGIKNTAERKEAHATWQISSGGGFLPSGPNVWRGKSSSHQISKEADAYGIAVLNGNQVTIADSSVDNIRSDSMHAFGIAVIGSSRSVLVTGVTVDEKSLQVGAARSVYSLPNLKSKPLPFYRDTANQGDVSFVNIKPKHLYVAPAGNCDFNPAGAGCPNLDGGETWEKNTCSGDTIPAAVDCVGTWSACTNSLTTHTITTPASNGGKPCSHVNGASYVCIEEDIPLSIRPNPVHCIGSWSLCDNDSQQTYVVRRPSRYGGALCPHNAGEQRTCVDTANHPPKTPRTRNCVFAYVGECDSKCTKEVVVVTPAKGGNACPNFSATNNRIRADCMGNSFSGQCIPSTNLACQATWSTCDAASCLKTYTIQQHATGEEPPCPFAQGTTQQCEGSCVTQSQPCIGRWSTCNPLSCNAHFVVEQTSRGAGIECTYAPGEIGGPGFDLDHLLVCPFSVPCPVAHPRPVPTCRWTECDSACKRTMEALNGAQCLQAHGTVDTSNFCTGGRGQCRVVHCEGEWSSCDSSCLRTFTITTPAQHGGNECSQANNAKSPSDCIAGSDSCVTVPTHANQDCAGAFTNTCNAQCKQTFVYTQLSLGTGRPCQYGGGQMNTHTCDTRASCSDAPATHQDCVYSWGECNESCLRNFIVHTQPRNPFTQCPYPNGTAKTTNCQPGYGTCPCASGNNDCIVHPCHTSTIIDGCNARAECYWDETSTAHPYCLYDECYLLTAAACTADKKCYIDPTNNNKCTPTKCYLHEAESPCNADPLCTYENNVCSHNICQDQDSVTCDALQTCSWDHYGGVCRVNRCSQHADVNACLTDTRCRTGNIHLSRFRPAELGFYTYSAGNFINSPLHPSLEQYTLSAAQSCLPNHCDVATSADECNARPYCTLKNEVCVVKKCYRRGFGGTPSDCDAVDGCTRNNFQANAQPAHYCTPVTKCEEMDGDRAACEAKLDKCVYNGSTQKCISHVCSRSDLRTVREACDNTEYCFFKDPRFDTSISQDSRCAPTICNLLTGAACTADPYCYLDRQDGTTCRGNPCFSHSSSCANELCEWKTDTTRCEPKPFEPTTSECSSLASNLLRCEVSKHCFVERGQCYKNPCPYPSSSPLSACESDHCFINHGVGSVCKPRMPCARSLEFYGADNKCTWNGLCQQPAPQTCTHKACAELNENECRFSFSSNERCTYVNGHCLGNLCGHKPEEACNSDSKCIWDIHYAGAPSPPIYPGRDQCMRDPCVGLVRDVCIATTSCHYAFSGNCIWNRCDGYTDQAKCVADLSCRFRDNKCVLYTCNEFSGDRLVCLAQPTCTHDSTACVVDNCVGKPKDSCTGECVFNDSNNVCTPITLCKGLKQDTCCLSDICHQQKAGEQKCIIDTCYGYGNKVTCEASGKCAWSLHDAASKQYKCVHNDCPGISKSECDKVPSCYYGNLLGSTTRNDDLCYFDYCRPYPDRGACTSAGLGCQWHNNACSSILTCLGANWSDDKCGDEKIIANPASKTCLNCLEAECCQKGERPPVAPIPKEGDDIGAGTIIGIVLGILLLLLLLLLLCCFCCKKSERRESDVLKAPYTSE